MYKLQRRYRKTTASGTDIWRDIDMPFAQGLSLEQAQEKLKSLRREYRGRGVEFRISAGWKAGESHV